MIKTNKPIDKKIVIIAPIGSLSGSYALGFQDYLNDCLDEAKCFQLIDLKRLDNIDGLGIKALYDFMERGGQVRLFNVNHQIRWMLEMGKGDNAITIYDESNIDLVVSMFEKEISDNEYRIKSARKSRQHVRVDTDLRAEFKYHPAHNGVITGRANVINLSESGMLADEISLFCETKGVSIDRPVINDIELYDIQFRLDKETEHIKTDGRCIRIIEKFDKLCAGIRFEKMQIGHRDKIKDFIVKKKLS